jgi:nitrate/nitrite transporter NarK
VASAWVVSHALIQVPAGVVVDRKGPWGLLVGSALVAAVGTAGFALARSVPLLVLSRFVVGLGTGTAFIAGLEAIVAAGRGRSMGPVRGAYGALVTVGASVGVLVPTFLYAVLDWAGTSLVIAGGCALLALLWSVPAAHPMVQSHEPETPHVSWLREPRVIAAAAAHVGGYGVYIGSLTWAVDFVIRDYGRSFTSGSVLVAAASALAIAGRLLGGLLNDLVGATRTVLWGMVITVLGLVVLAGKMALTIALVGFAMTCFATNLSFAAVFSPALVPNTQRGSALGFVSFAGNVGVLVVVLTIGTMLQHVGRYQAAWAAVAAVVVVLTCAVAVLERRADRTSDGVPA